MKCAYQRLSLCSASVDHTLDVASDVAAAAAAVAATVTVAVASGNGSASNGGASLVSRRGDSG